MATEISRTEFQELKKEMSEMQNEISILKSQLNKRKYFFILQQLTILMRQ